MSRRAEDPAIEERIYNDAIVDARPEEQAMSWYYYVEEKLSFPFQAECRVLRKTSPLVLGEVLSVKEMADMDECEKEMFVLVEWQGRELAVPLIQLKPLEADDETFEAVDDWHYWMERGYEF